MANKPLKIILITFISLIILMGSGFYILWMKIQPPDPQVKEEDEISSEESRGDSDPIRPVFDLSTFIVNLADQENPCYLRTSITLELTGKDAFKEVGNRLSQIKNIILTTLPLKKVADITSIEGKCNLGEELQNKLNHILKEGSVTKIYFTEFIIQQV